MREFQTSWWKLTYKQILKLISSHISRKAHRCSRQICNWNVVFVLLSWCKNWVMRDNWQMMIVTASWKLSPTWFVTLKECQAFLILWFFYFKALWTYFMDYVTKSFGFIFANKSIVCYSISNLWKCFIIVTRWGWTWKRLEHYEPSTSIKETLKSRFECHQRPLENYFTIFSKRKRLTMENKFFFALVRVKLKWLLSWWFSENLNICYSKSRRDVTQHTR